MILKNVVGALRVTLKERNNRTRFVDGVFVALMAGVPAAIGYAMGELAGHVYGLPAGSNGIVLVRLGAAILVLGFEGYFVGRRVLTSKA
ncbi:hypothetical protein ACN8ZM_39895 (plasmid) [Burkholderia aenigmatica]|uniref:hypothetical protein n=1 Tax=Burkholderia aenigmatica TaxID=2015348 RepID=UPI003B42F9D9